MPKLVDYKGSRYEERESFIVGNTKTIQKGDWVTLDATITSRSAERATNSSTMLLGTVVGFTTIDGADLTSSSAAALGSSFNEKTQTLVSKSDNVTVGKIKVVVNIHQDAVYEQTADDTLGTTSGSDMPWNYFGTAHALVDESSVSATTGQLLSVGVKDATTLYVKMVKSFKNMTSIS